MLYEKNFCKNFTKPTWKYLRRSLFLTTFFSPQVPTQVISCEFYEIFKNTFITEHLRTIAFLEQQRSDRGPTPTLKTTLSDSLKERARSKNDKLIELLDTGRLTNVQFTSCVWGYSRRGTIMQVSNRSLALSTKIKINIQRSK